MVMSFPRYLIASTATFLVVVMKFLRKYMPMYLIVSCAFQLHSYILHKHFSDKIIR